jgi:hypothetical protein
VLRLPMARRPEFPPKAMTRGELKHSLSLLNSHAIRDNYAAALESSRLRADAPPPPQTMRRLVTLWKILWRWRG